MYQKFKTRQMITIKLLRHSASSLAKPQTDYLQQFTGLATTEKLYCKSKVQKTYSDICFTICASCIPLGVKTLVATQSVNLSAALVILTSTIQSMS